MVCETKDRTLRLDPMDQCIAESGQCDERSSLESKFESQFLTAKKNCLQQSSHNNFEVVTPGKKPGFFMIVTERESSRIWACLKYREFLYYPAVWKRHW